VCLILLSLNQHPNYPLILASNRDEFFKRPSKPLHTWNKPHKLIAGKDLDAGGTWLGITPDGRFAAITNFREFPQSTNQNKGKALLSRGKLSHDFLASTQSAAEYIDELKKTADCYPGYNLLLGELSGSASQISYYSNRSEAGPATLASGYHGLSNALLNTPWPKVEEGKAAMHSLLSGQTPRFCQPGLDTPTNEQDISDELFKILANRKRYATEQLPDTGIGMEKEALLSSRFIYSDHEHFNYGTRASTTLVLSAGGSLSIREKSFNSTGGLIGQEEFHLQL
jgi:uncharacterized protein with NRDE domain